MVIEQNSEFIIRTVQIKTSKEQWARFDAWAAHQGYQSLAEAFRALIINTNEGNNQGEPKTNIQTQSARAG